MWNEMRSFVYFRVTETALDFLYGFALVGAAEGSIFAMECVRVFRIEFEINTILF